MTKKGREEWRELQATRWWLDCPVARTAAPPARLLPKKNIVPFQVNCFTVFRGYVFYCVVCGKKFSRFVRWEK